MTRKLFEYGGWIAGAVLIAFGVVAIFMGVNGRSEVRDALAEQKIKDLNAFDLDHGARIIAGTARSMGITVEG